MVQFVFHGAPVLLAGQVRVQDDPGHAVLFKEHKAADAGRQVGECYTVIFHLHHQVRLLLQME